MQLSDYVGQSITLASPIIDPEKMTEVKLLGVEAGGIWVESQNVVEVFLRLAGQTSSPISVAAFLPYSELRFVCVPIDGVALDEKALLG